MSEKEDKPVAPQGREDSFLPSFCSIRMVFAVVVTAELLAIVLSLSSIDSLVDFTDALSLRSLYIQWIALGGAAMLCALHSWLRGLGNRAAGLAAWGILMLITLAVALAADAFLHVGGAFLPKSLIISGIVSALVLHYLYLQYLWRQQVEAESRAHFQALQSRIRPHFLFNSMNTIANLTRTNPALAEEVVHDLSDLFRASLAKEQQVSTLEEELELCRGYLRIEQERLGERLKVEWDLEGLPDDAVLPPLIFQPLLENAVYHGVEPSPGQGGIWIVGRYRRRQVNISIRNSLPGDEASSRRVGNSMALENIRQRLGGFFDDQASLSMSEVDGQYQVRVVFPHPWEGR